jgi:NDP-sugar pyrophosphorylase family protein
MMHEMVSEDSTEEKLKSICVSVGGHLYLRKGAKLDTKKIPSKLSEQDKGDLQVVFSMGGEGTRLRHITQDKYSKHMIEAGGRPISSYVIGMWADAGFSNMRLLVDDTHRGSSIIAYYKDGRALGSGTRISYSIEHSKLSSGGALRYAIDNGSITESFINHFPDDIVVNYPKFAEDFSKVVIAAFREGYECVVVCAPGKLYPYGVVEDKDGEVTDFLEKPFIEMDTNTGIFALSKESFPMILGLEKEKDLKIERTVLRDIARSGRMLKVLLPTELWIPINDEPNLNKFAELVGVKE